MMNEAQIIVFACQKGGSGKTTLSGHIAVEAERMGGGPVALIDTDPQGSLAKWWNARGSETPAFAQITVSELHRDIEALRKSGFRLIVIDTPPAITTAIAEVIMHADLVVLPTRPSPHDLRAIGPTVDIVEHQRKPLVFVINAATARARITGETAVALSQHGTVAPVTLHQRVDFAASMIDGRTVGEVNPDSRSAKEVNNLWNYLSDRLVRLRSESELVITEPRQTLEAGLLTPMSEMPVAAEAPPPGAPAPATSPATSPESGASPEAGSVASFMPVDVPLGSDRLISDEQRQALQPDGRGALSVTQPANGNWDGIDRRMKDSGPPKGALDRRRARPGFGRRESA